MSLLIYLAAETSPQKAQSTVTEEPPKNEQVTEKKDPEPKADEPKVDEPKVEESKVGKKEEDHQDTVTSTPENTSKAEIPNGNSKVEEETPSCVDDTSKRTSVDESTDVSSITEQNSPATEKAKKPKTLKKKVADMTTTVPRLPGKERFVSYFFVVGHGPELEPVEPRRNSKQFIINDLLIILVPDPLKNVYKAELLECFPHSNKEDPFPPHLWMVSIVYCKLIQLVLSAQVFTIENQRSRAINLSICSHFSNWRQIVRNCLNILRNSSSGLNDVAQVDDSYHCLRAKMYLHIISLALLFSIQGMAV
jgi:hypothetical protein